MGNAPHNPYEVAMDRFLLGNLNDEITTARQMFDLEHFAHMKGLAQSYLDEIQALVQQLQDNDDPNRLYFDDARHSIAKIVIAYREELVKNAPPELRSLAAGSGGDVTRDPLALLLDSMCDRVEHATMTMDFSNRAKAQSFVAKLDALEESNNPTVQRARLHLHNVMENRGSTEAAYGGPFDAKWINTLVDHIERPFQLGELSKPLRKQLLAILAQTQREERVFLGIGEREQVLNVDRAFGRISRYRLVKRDEQAKQKPEQSAKDDAIAAANQLLARHHVEWELEQTAEPDGPPDPAPATS